MPHGLSITTGRSGAEAVSTASGSALDVFETISAGWYCNRGSGGWKLHGHYPEWGSRSRKEKIYIGRGRGGDRSRLIYMHHFYV